MPHPSMYLDVNALQAALSDLRYCQAHGLEDAAKWAAMELGLVLIRGGCGDGVRVPNAEAPSTAPVAPPEPTPPVRAITPAQRRRRCAGAARARARRAAGAGA